jgi:hypothetical protein
MEPLLAELTITDLVRDWLPSFALLVAGTWVCFNWVVAERLRRRREVIAIDSALNARAVDLPERKCAVTLEATFRNRTPFTVNVDTVATRIDVFTIPPDIALGYLDTREDLGEPVFRAYPYKNMNQFVFEPNTDSILQHHFILKQGAVYLFRWKLYRHSQKNGKPFAYTKEYVHDATARSHNEAIQPTGICGGEISPEIDVDRAAYPGG